MPEYIQMSPKKVWESIFCTCYIATVGTELSWERIFRVPKGIKGPIVQTLDPLVPQLSVAGTNWGYQETDWGPLRPQDVGRRVAVTELERQIVWEEGPVWKNARNVVKMTNTNFKHTTSTTNMRPSIPESSLLFYCLRWIQWIHWFITSKSMRKKY